MPRPKAATRHAQAEGRMGIPLVSTRHAQAEGRMGISLDRGPTFSRSCWSDMHRWNLESHRFGL